MELRDFLVEAKKAGYAASGQEGDRLETDGAKEFRYQAEGFCYQDRYWGSDVKNMKREELFSAAQSFLYWGLAFLAALFIIGLIGLFFAPEAAVEPSLVQQVLMFAFSFGALMGLGGSFYLFIQGLFRSKK